ncbi:hypothetical protein GQ472_00620 [archaeon]|nr:hypothetical protein [archaeon]
MAFQSDRQRKAVMSKLHTLRQMMTTHKRVKYVKPSKELAKTHPTLLKVLSPDVLTKKKVGDSIAFSDIEGKPVSGKIAMMDGSFAKGDIAYVNILITKPLRRILQIQKYQLKYNPKYPYDLEIVDTTYT